MLQSYSELAQVLAKVMGERGDVPEYAGAPIPLPDHPVTIEEKYPYRGLETMYGEEKPQTFENPTERVVNHLNVRKWGYGVVLTQREEDDQTKASAFLTTETESTQRLRMLIDTLAVSIVWPLDAEWTAMEKLQGMISAHAFRTYVLTGMFLETSKRSGVTYLFRRLRPTIALRQNAETGFMRVLAALCLHPIAYYKNTWCGTMVPTDDVIAHLLLMRGDEPLFWRRAEQHAVDRVASGL